MNKFTLAVNDSVCGVLSSLRSQGQGIFNDGISQMLLSWEGMLPGHGASSSSLGPLHLLHPGGVSPDPHLQPSALMWGWRAASLAPEEASLAGWGSILYERKGM